MSFNSRVFRHTLGYYNSDLYGVTPGTARKGNNIITKRSTEVMTDYVSMIPSKSFTEAKMKERRMYKRFCRLMPNLLKTHNLSHMINPI